MFSLSFWKAAGERAVGAFSAPVIGALVADGASLWDVPWKGTLGVAGAAALASLLGSVANAGVGPECPGLTEKVAKPGSGS